MIKTSEEDTPTTSTGTPYDTTDHKPSTITTEDGKVYYYKEVKSTSASETGDVVEGTTTVQYVYEQAGNVIVHYITEDGTVIKATVTDEENAEPGRSYTTTDNKPTTITTEDGTVYELIPTATIGNKDGSVEAGKTIEITYVYRKVEAPKSVVTNHVDEEGNVISPQEDGTTPNKGTSIPGYEFTGKTITDENGNTTHIYRKVVTPVDPKAPVQPGVPVKPETLAKPGVPTKPEASAKPTYVAETLPNTGEDNSASVAAMGAGMILASLGLAAKRRRKED